MVSDARRDLAVSIAIPLVSFGGIPVAIALARLGYIDNPGPFGWGCVLGSLLLAYLAYLKPRRDIVSFSAPIFAFFIFVAPLELPATVLTQVLFAATLTALVVRLNRSFSKKQGDAGTAVPVEEED